MDLRPDELQGCHQGKDTGFSFLVFNIEDFVEDGHMQNALTIGTCAIHLRVEELR